MDKKYLELLKYEQALNLNGKSLSIENEPDYIKLITYEINFFDHFVIMVLVAFYFGVKMISSP